MSFNLPSAQYLMDSNASNNKGDFGSNSFSPDKKTAGNLPITEDAASISNNSGERGIIFGLESQTSSTAIDASGETKVLLTSVQFNAPNRIQVETLANSGVVARIYSIGSRYREFKIGGNDTPFGSAQAGPVTICLDLNDTSFQSSSGTFDNSQIKGWGYGTSKQSLAGSASNFQYFQRVFLFDTVKGAPNLPTFSGTSSFNDAVTATQGTDYTNKIGSWAVKLAASIFLPCPFSIGNGSVATNFNDNSASIISPSSNSAGQENFRLTVNAMRVYLDMRDNSSDSVILSGAYAWGTAADWDFNISNDSTCLLSGTFTGMGTFKIGSSVTATGTFNLASGKEVECTGADIDNITVSAGLKIKSNAVTSFTKVASGSMEFDTAGTYYLDGCTIGEVINTSGGAVIINNINSTITTNTGPNITIVIPQSILTVAVNETGADVVILAAGTNTVLASVDAQAGTDFLYSFNGTFNIDIGVIKKGFIVNYTYTYGLTASDATLPINLIVDRNYS